LSARRPVRVRNYDHENACPNDGLPGDVNVRGHNGAAAHPFSPINPTRVAPKFDPDAQFDDELLPFESPQGNFEILIPESWEPWPSDPVQRTSASEDGQEALTAWRFGKGSGGGTRGAPALVVSIGTEGGGILACGYVSCQERVATTLDGLDEALISTPDFFPGVEVGGVTTMLGGTAWFEHPEYVNNGLGAPSEYYVYAIRNGRPVVLAFDWWNIRFARLGDGAALLGSIIESFHLLED
jgi:hypothetical protein